MVEPQGAISREILETANMVNVRARLLKAWVLMGVGGALAVGVMGVLVQNRLLWLLFPLPVAVGVAFVWADERILARWRARVTSAWEAGIFGMEEFRRTAEALPIPRSTLAGMLATLPGGWEGPEPGSLLLREGLARISEGLHQVHSDRHLSGGLARFLLVAGIFLPLAFHSWLALSLIPASGVVFLAGRPMAELRGRRCRQRIQALQAAGLDLRELRHDGLSGLDSQDAERIQGWLESIGLKPPHLTYRRNTKNEIMT